MALATDVITTERLRDSIGEVGDESDSIIESYRSSAIDWLEHYTGRCIIDRDSYVSEESDFMYSHRMEPDYIGWDVSDIKSGNMVIRYADHDSDPLGQGDQTLTIQTTDPRVQLTQSKVIVFSSDRSEWTGVMRYKYPTPILTANRGMSAASIPSAWGDACALIVRAIYDGTAYDDLGSMSVLKYLMGPYRCGAYMRTART